MWPINQDQLGLLMWKFDRLGKSGSCRDTNNLPF